MSSRTARGRSAQRDESTRVQGGRLVALVAALGGLFASGYLLADYLSGGGGICLTGSGCDAVRLSPFAYPLGVPLPLVGVAFFGVAATLVLATTSSRPELARAAGLGLAAVGLAAGLVSIVLTALELFVIRALCSWCLAVTAAALTLVPASLLVARAVSAHAAAPTSARSRRIVRERQRGERRQMRVWAARTLAILGGLTLALVAAGALERPAVIGRGQVAVAAPDRPRLGSGAIEIVVFSDFQCPACAVAAPLLEEVTGDGRVTLTYRYFPLTSIHPNAALAAAAAEAAHRQGAFWRFHDRLFASQREWSELEPAAFAIWLDGRARELGLDLERWRSDLRSEAIVAEVDEDVAFAASLGLPGTPTIFVADRPYSGPLSLDGLRSAIEAAAAED
ncbi:MAG TPA: vitamin K epoxide reductase family protein [Candidatus Limnocylindrales bacterium]|nr:vitamin K epoxide reductase family protein [Candidatus Limnocylindrales bacterium]